MTKRLYSNAKISWLGQSVIPFVDKPVQVNEKRRQPWNKVLPKHEERNGMAASLRPRGILIRAVLVAAMVFWTGTAQTDDASTAPWTEDSEDSHDRFSLWTYCQPLELWTSVNDEAESGARIDEESVRSMIESRLHSARLYSKEADVILEVTASRVGYQSLYPFSFSIALRKAMYDLRTGLKGRPLTWQTVGFGVGSPEFFHSSLSGHIDTFLADYLSVNQTACNRAAASLSDPNPS